MLMFQLLIQLKRITVVFSGNQQCENEVNTYSSQGQIACFKAAEVFHPFTTDI
jgi:hypothetical protein